MKPNNSMKHSILVIIILSVVLFTGCTLETQQEEVSQVQVAAWIDQPVTNTQHPLAPVEITFHGASGQSIQAYQVFIDDQLVEDSSPPADGEHVFQNLETISTTWIPQAPGEYMLKVRVQSDQGTWSDTAAVTFTILGPTSPSPSETALPSPTPTSTPTITPTIPSGTILSEPEVSTELFYYRFSDCADRTPNTVTISVTASDPAGIVNVELYFRLKNKTTNELTEWQSVVMRHDGNGVYSYTLDADVLPTFVGNKESWLQYQLIANNNDSAITRSEVYFDVTIKGCEP